MKGTGFPLKTAMPNMSATLVNTTVPNRIGIERNTGDDTWEPSALVLAFHGSSASRPLGTADRCQPSCGCYAEPLRELETIPVDQLQLKNHLVEKTLPMELFTPFVSWLFKNPSCSWNLWSTYKLWTLLQKAELLDYTILLASCPGSIFSFKTEFWAMCQIFCL